MRIALLVTLSGAAGLGALLSAGVADPPHAGSLIVQDDLNTLHGWSVWPNRAQLEVSGDGLIVSAPATGMRAQAISPYTFRVPATLEVVGRQAGGPADANYGIWWGSCPDGACTVAAVNGNGYFAIYRIRGQAVEMIYPWARFPWVRPHGEPNRLRVDLEAAQATIRINQEVVAVVAGAETGLLHMGVLAETQQRAPSQVEYTMLSIWAAAEAGPTRQIDR